MDNLFANLTIPSIAGAEEKEAKAWVGQALARVKENRLKYGPSPHYGQELLHMSQELFVLVIAANRWGKTFAGMRDVLWSATMTHPYRPAKPMNVIWCGFPENKFFNRVTRKAFDYWIPKKIEVTRGTKRTLENCLIQFHETDKWAKVRRADGGECTIYFMSYELERTSWQGAGIDMLWLDEELPEDIFNEAFARTIDTMAQVIVTQTPLSGLAWLYDRYYLPIKDRRRAGTLVEGALAEYDPDQPFGVGRILVPHRTYEQVLLFASNIPDEDERMIRVFGQFRARTGTVYKMFRPEVSVIPAFTIPKHWEVWGGVDPGFHGFAVAFFAMSPSGRMYLISEYFSQEEPLRIRAKEIRDRAVRILGGEDAMLLDERTIAFYVDTEDPQLVLELNLYAADNDLPFSFASLEQGKKARKAGITRLQELMTPDPARGTPPEIHRPRSSSGEPLFYIFDSLGSKWRETSGDDITAFEESRALWEITRYLWKKPGTNDPHPMDADEKSAGGAHMLSAIRYAAMARMGAPEELPDDKYAEAGPVGAKVWKRLDEMDNQEERWVVE